MPKVYVPQLPRRRDQATNKFVPVVNIAPAEEHGEVVVLLPPDATFYATRDIIELLEKDLRQYDFDAGDCIISIGDPSILAVVIGLVAKRVGRFNLLKWDRKSCRYNKVKVVLP